MLPKDRIVCALVEPLAVGQRFTRWPLHVTIVPWFRLDEDSSAIAAGLQHALYGFAPFQARGAGEAIFGPRKRSVRLLEQPTQLSGIENTVRTYLHKKRALLIDETTKQRYSFRPHVTAQADTNLPEGASFRVDRLYIIEQKGDYKEIVSEVRLSE